jgi:DNA polymerase-3 subunit delta
MTVIVIKGDDETLVAQAVAGAVSELVGDGDRALMVEELTEAAYLGEDNDPSLVPLINSAQTMPFLTDRRVVVARNLGLFSKQATVEPLVDLLAGMPDTTDLVLVWEKASSSQRLPAVPKSLQAAFKSVGAEMVDAAPKGRGRKMALDERLASAPVRLDASAKRTIADRLGDDLGRLSSVFDTLVSTFGADAALSADDVAPFLGAASDVPPWELTDAIDSGDITLALGKLDRMLIGGERHPLQTLATLHNHYERALQLDGAPVFDDRSAADHLGMTGSTFPAKKALALSRRLGPERLGRATALLAKSDLDLRGATALDGRTVMTVLVARLAHLSRA